MKQTRGARKQLKDGVVVSWQVEREQHSLVKIVGQQDGRTSQSEAIRDMITYWADGHKI